MLNCSDCGKPTCRSGQAKRCRSCTRVRKEKLRRERNQRLKDAGLCRDCLNASRTVRCLPCSRHQKARLRKRGRCINCAGQKDATNSICDRCTLKTLARRKLGDRSRWRFLERLLAKQRGLCAVTGVPIKIGCNASLDRITPENRGGSNSSANLRWVHLVVNRMKNDMLDQELLDWCRLITANSERLSPDRSARPRKSGWPQHHGML